MFDFMVTVELGLESIALDDLKKHFGVSGSTDSRRGKIFFRGSEELIYLLNYSARSINKVFILLTRSTITSLDELRSVIASINWQEYIKPQQTFAVQVNRVGEHEFTSLDIAKTAGDAIRDTFGLYKPRVNLKNPHVPILIDVYHNELIVAINTTGRSLHIRRYRVFAHPYALKTTLAYAMLLLGEWSPDNSLLDPTCGGGTIPIEAVLYGRRIPHLMFRSEYAFKSFSFLDPNLDNRIRETLLASMDPDKQLDIICIEKNKEYFDGLLRNLENSKTKDTIRPILGDALRVLGSIDRTFDRIIFNPPYHGRNIKLFYRKLLEKLKSITSDDARIVFITPHRLDNILTRLKFEFSVKTVFREPSLPNRIYILRQ